MAVTVFFLRDGGVRGHPPRGSTCFARGLIVGALIASVAALAGYFQPSSPVGMTLLDAV